MVRIILTHITYHNIISLNNIAIIVIVIEQLFNHFYKI